MKKTLFLFLTVIMVLCCLSSCSEYQGKINSDINENYFILELDGFSGRHTVKLKRELKGEGAVYYQANLTSGTLAASFYEDGIMGTQYLFTVEAGETIDGNSGYVEGNGKIEFTFEADAPVSGEIIIAFTEEALKAIRKDLQLHEHTFRYETTNDTHKVIYTCECDWLEERSHEPHCDGDVNGYCDECEFYTGIPHEHSSWYETNKTSHRQIFECGCESLEDYEPHLDSDGDDWCDICRYGSLSAKEQLFIGNVIELAAKGESLTWSDFEQYESIETGSGLYILVYDIDDTFQLIIGGSGRTEDPPMYIRLALKNDIDTYVDVRSGTAEVKAFFETYGN